MYLLLYPTSEVAHFTPFSKSIYLAFALHHRPAVVCVKHCVAGCCNPTINVSKTDSVVLCVSTGLQGNVECLVCVMTLLYFRLARFVGTLQATSQSVIDKTLW